jgi:hypothetical protein
LFLRQLFADFVIALSRLKLLNIRRRPLWPIDSQCQLVDLSGEFELHFIVLIVHRCGCVGADIKIFLPLQVEWKAVSHRLRGHSFAVHRKDTGATAANIRASLSLSYGRKFRHRNSYRQRVRPLTPANSMLNRDTFHRFILVGSGIQLSDSC